MEYIEGLTLKEYVNKNGRLAPEKVIELMLPVMTSLNYMHSKGIIHRDISPDNIMISKRGRLKLMDFGSARYFTNEERKMSVVLKQGFAPEEQYRANGTQGPYTDVYALCATMYACMTGSVPVSSLDRLIGDTLQPPSRLGVWMKPYQEYALMHGLAVYAKNRTPNISVLIKELTDEAAFAAMQEAVPPTKNNARTPLIIIAVILGVLLIGGGVFTAIMLSRGNGNSGGESPDSSYVSLLPSSQDTQSSQDWQESQNSQRSQSSASSFVSSGTDTIAPDVRVFGFGDSLYSPTGELLCTDAAIDAYNTEYEDEINDFLIEDGSYGKHTDDGFDEYLYGVGNTLIEELWFDRTFTGEDISSLEASMDDVEDSVRLDLETIKDYIGRDDCALLMVVFDKNGDAAYTKLLK